MFRRCLTIGLLACVMLAASGCEDNNEGSSSVPDISGDWSGFYQFPGGTQVPLSATVGVNGNDLFVMTTLSGTAHLLTGTINEHGRVFLTDAYDGDTWSVEVPVTSHAIYLIDYAFGPATSLRRMTLTR
jgi:hypothetical protein